MKRLPEFPNPTGVLLFGGDKKLLDTRALVLRSAQIAVDVTTDIDELKRRIADPERIVGAVICCYMSNDAEREEILAATASSRITLWQLDCFVAPLDLIAKVSDILRRRNSAG
jgi:hypothetical protein